MRAIGKSGSRARAGLAAALSWWVAAPATALLVDLRSPVDPSGFTLGPDDCRDTTPRSCRGLLFADDGAVPLTGTYVAFSIENDEAVDYGDLWVRLEGFDDEDAPGSLVRIAPDQADSTAGSSDTWTASYHLGALSAGETKTAFFLLEVVGALSSPGPETRPDLSVWDGPPGSGTQLPVDTALPVCPVAARSCALPGGGVEWPFIYNDTLTANPNKVLSVVTTPGDPTVGGIVEVTVVGESGLTGGAADYDRDGIADALIAPNPTAVPSWPAGHLELQGARITLSGADACGLADCSCSQDPPAPGECAFARADGGAPACEFRTPSPSCVVQEEEDDLELISSSATSFDVVALYYFEAVAPQPPTPLTPIQFITSGAQIKHNDLGPVISACDDGTGHLDPDATGCCEMPDVWCTLEVMPEPSLPLSLATGVALVAGLTRRRSRA